MDAPRCAHASISAGVERGGDPFPGERGGLGVLALPDGRDESAPWSTAPATVAAACTAPSAANVRSEKPVVYDSPIRPVTSTLSCSASASASSAPARSPASARSSETRLSALSSVASPAPLRMSRIASSNAASPASASSGQRASPSANCA